jgi:hypothetical protein
MTWLLLPPSSALATDVGVHSSKTASCPTDRPTDDRAKIILLQIEVLYANEKVAQSGE